MANANETTHISADQNRNREKSFRAILLQIFAPNTINARISLDVIAHDGSCREKQFLYNCVQFPEEWVLNERMLRIWRNRFSAVRHRAQNERVPRLVKQPQA